VVSTHEPGATDTGGKVRQILLNRGDAALSPRAEALLFAADRADHVDTVIRPALESGAVVLTDRYVDSSLAYQGAGRALALDEIRQLSKWATDGLRPDLTVLLDLDPEIGLARVDKRGVADRLEQESLDFHRRVREAFGSLAESNPDAYLVLPADRDPDSLAGEVAAVIDGLLRARGIPAPEAEEDEVDAADPVDEDRDEDDGGVAEPMSRPTPESSQDRSELERKR
jgi:dTMP kinase